MSSILDQLRGPAPGPAGPGAAPGIAGPPPSISVPPPGAVGPGGPGGDGPDSPQSAAALQEAEAAIQKFISLEKDPQDKAIGSKILQQIHAISAARAKEVDQALGVSPAVKMLRRSQQG